MYRKTTVSDSLFKQSCRRQADLKRDSKTVFFKKTSGRLLWKSILFAFVWQFFTCISEIIGTFWERFIFQIIGPFLLSMSGFIPWSQGILMSLATERNNDYIDKVFMRAWTLRLSNIFGVSKNQIKFLI